MSHKNLKVFGECPTRTLKCSVLLIDPLHLASTNLDLIIFHITSLVLFIYITLLLLLLFARVKLKVLDLFISALGEHGASLL
jgi:hypothetical protein